jgi:plasmid stability protein
MHWRQNGCMGTTNVTIRNVPDDVRDELAARAASVGRSLQEHLLAELTELARKPSAEVVLARIRARKSATGTSLSGKEILRLRDADRK